MKEFRVGRNDSGEASYPYYVEWFGADGRVVAACHHRHEAQEIARLLNEAGTAAKWYKRAKTGLYMGAVAVSQEGK